MDFYTETYFKKHTYIPYLEIICNNKHIDYIQIPYDDASIFTKIQRRKYINTINNWLKEPVTNVNGFMYYVDSDNENNENYDDFYNNTSLTQVVKEYNTYEHLDINYDWNDEYDEQYYNEDNDYEDCVKNADICEKLHDTIINELDNANYTIYDLNQFKEDFIHYMYRLSDID
jgi:hypothetical protein